MKWTKERKIYATLLAVGLSALAVDRLTRPTPEPAESPTALTVARPTPAAKSATTPNQLTASAQTASFTDRLRRAAAPSSDKPNSSDIFRPSALWANAPAAAADGQTPAAPPDEIVRFRAAHRLTAVIVGRRTIPDRALIDGTPLRVGQTLDKFRLVAVEQDNATLQSRAGRRITLTLEDAAPKALAHTDR